MVRFYNNGRKDERIDVKPAACSMTETATQGLFSCNVKSGDWLMGRVRRRLRRLVKPLGESCPLFRR